MSVTIASKAAQLNEAAEIMRDAEEALNVARDKNAGKKRDTLKFTIGQLENLPKTDEVLDAIDELKQQLRAVEIQIRDVASLTMWFECKKANYEQLLNQSFVSSFVPPAQTPKTVPKAVPAPPVEVPKSETKDGMDKINKRLEELCMRVTEPASNSERHAIKRAMELFKRDAEAHLAKCRAEAAGRDVFFVSNAEWVMREFAVLQSAANKF